MGRGKRLTGELLARKVPSFKLLHKDQQVLYLLYSIFQWVNNLGAQEMGVVLNILTIGRAMA